MFGLLSIVRNGITDGRDREFPLFGYGILETSLIIQVVATNETYNRIWLKVSSVTTTED